MTTTNALEDAALGAPDTGKSPSRARGRKLELLEAWALPLITLLIAIFFSLYPSTSSTFPTTQNLQTLLANQSVIAIIALAALVPLVLNQFDLSVGATLGLSSVFAAAAMSNGAAIWTGVLIAVAIGLGVGLVNGFVITRTRVNAVIVTLGTAIVIGGIMTQKTKGLSIAEGIPQALTNFGSGTLLGVPKPALMLALVALLLYYVLEQTPFGRYLYSMGSNEEAARLVGLNTRRLLLMSFVIAGLLAGIAGILQLSRSGSASAQIGENFTLPALAAAFLSAAAIKPGRFNVWGTLVAVLFLAVLNSGLNLAGAETYVNDYVNGVALVGGVALAVLLGRQRSGEAG
ncbi:MAG: ABC transporter permease [Solirubrobacterales bacterium]